MYLEKIIYEELDVCISECLTVWWGVDEDKFDECMGKCEEKYGTLQQKG